MSDLPESSSAPAAALPSREREHRGLEAAEAHVEIAAVEHRARQRHRAVAAGFRETRELRPTRIGQSKELRRLVEGLAGSIVLRVAEEPVTADALDVEELGVPARDEQRDERKFGLRIREQRRQQMAFEVMHADDRLAEREAERIRDGCADKERAREARSLRVRDAIEFGESRFRPFEHALGKRNDTTDVIARGEFGDYAPVGDVQRDLRMELVREQPALRVVHGEARFRRRKFRCRGHAFGRL